MNGGSDLALGQSPAWGQSGQVQQVKLPITPFSDHNAGNIGERTF
jgi:hypothetical protein